MVRYHSIPTFSFPLLRSRLVSERIEKVANGRYPIVYLNALESKLYLVENLGRNDLEWVRNNRNSADISNYLEYEDVADLNSDENPDWIRCECGTTATIRIFRTSLSTL